MISQGYGDAKTIGKRIAQMEDWLANPCLLQADDDAEYAAIVEVNLDDLKEPILALPNDPDACALLSDVQGTRIDEAFIGSCMTNLTHFRTASTLLSQNPKKSHTRLWLTPPTKMDEAQLRSEGHFSVFGTSGARMEIPGCSLCMGNQARVADGTNVVSTSTRNFPSRLGQDTNVYLASAELVCVASIKGALPTVEEYIESVERAKKSANSRCYISGSIK
jgi:aconitate hydratase 2/2-methylisocitrate dehydratase